MASAKRLIYSGISSRKDDNSNLSKYRLDLTRLSNYMEHKPLIHHVINDLISHLYSEKADHLSFEQKMLIINTLKELNVLKLIDAEDEMQTPIKTESPSDFFGSFVNKDIDNEINPGIDYQMY